MQNIDIFICIGFMHVSYVNICYLKSLIKSIIECETNFIFILKIFIIIICYTFI